MRAGSDEAPSVMVADEPESDYESEGGGGLLAQPAAADIVAGGDAFDQIHGGEAPTQTEQVRARRCLVARAPHDDLARSMAVLPCPPVSSMQRKATLSVVCLLY